MNVIKEIERINKRELELGICGGTGKGSWHDKYKDSAWIYFGGFSYELSEGDIICVLSQWGEIEDINLVRDKATNKSMGFAFVKYEDQRSTILAVDNFNGIKLLGRTLRCDHVDRYKLPKNIREQEEKALEEDPNREVAIGPGHAYSDKSLANEFSIQQGQDVWATSISASSRKRQLMTLDSLLEDDMDEKDDRKTQKEDKKKKKHKEKKRHRKEHYNDDEGYRDKTRHKDHDKNAYVGSGNTSATKETAGTGVDREDRNSSRLGGRASQAANERVTLPTSRRAHSDSDARTQVQLQLEIERVTKTMSGQFAEAPTQANAAVTQSGSFASWRGRRDPLASAAAVQDSRKFGSGGGGGGDKVGGPASGTGTGSGRRGEFEGFGGMLRRR